MVGNLMVTAKVARELANEHNANVERINKFMARIEQAARRGAFQLTVESAQIDEKLASVLSGAGYEIKILRVAGEPPEAQISW